MNKDKFRDYFYNRCNQTEEKAIQRWLSKTEDVKEIDDWMREIFDEIQVTDNKLARNKFEDFCSLTGYTNLHKKNLSLSGATLIHFAQKIAAFLLLPLMVSALYFYNQSQETTEWIEEYVAFGQTKEVLLPDSTRLSLNAGTHLYYPREFKGKERKIFVNGEIFADVYKDKDHPFVISAGEIKIKVLGTKFNFRSYIEDKLVEVVLTEGSVQFSNEKGIEDIMKSGEVLHYDRENSTMVKEAFNPGLYKSFAEGRGICFLNQPFAEIATQLERLFDCKIVLMDEQLGAEQYIAYFTNNESVGQILHTLNVDGSMDITFEGDIIYIKSANQE